MTPIEQAMARLQKIVDEVGEIGWIEAGDVADIRTVLDELTRLRAALPKTAAQIAADIREHIEYNADYDEADCKQYQNPSIDELVAIIRSRAAALDAGRGK